VLKLIDEIVSVEELSVPSPHYRVTIKAAGQGHPDLRPGLLRDEFVVTVCLPMDIGTDLPGIKLAATRRLAALLGETSKGLGAKPLVVSRTDGTACSMLSDRPGDERQSEERH